MKDEDAESRFRFRVWNEEEKNWSEHLYNNGEGRIAVDWFWNGCEIDSQYNAAEDSQFVIEQCTGIRDANGKLIYEGDVLDATEDGFENRLVVRWNKTFGGFTLENTRRGGVSLNTLIAATMMKIIGNIHENPEILKQ